MTTTDGRVRRVAFAVLTLSLLIAHSAQAQAPGNINSRAEEIEAARREKAAKITPETVSGTENALIQIKEKRILERITYGIGGLRLKIGGLVTGSGFAIGPEYFRDDLAGGDVVFRASARASFSRYQLYDIELQLPRLANGAAFLNLLAVHRNYPRLDYYGQGPDSRKTGRSNYRLEDTSFGFATGVRPMRPLKLGVTGDFLEVNVGPGTHPRIISAERIYGPNTTPGINDQTDFLRGGFFAQLDTRDNPGGPRSGINYLAVFTYNKDTELSRHSHRKLYAEAQNYIPLFNKRRVIAIRGKTELTYKNAGQTIPFYMQPQVGGSDDLRGFRNFRFYDDNSLVFNGEYRYEIFSGMDMALFADAGKVFRSKSQLNFKDLEGSYGIGMRFNARNNVFLRIDAGFSHEGFMVWFKFNNVF